jgi:hypothetical protein
MAISYEDQVGKEREYIKVIDHGNIELKKQLY